jgi:hypothetical protein
MAGVEFNDAQKVQYVARQKGITNLVISWGLAKDAKSAQVVLLIIAAGAIAIALFFMFSGKDSQVEENFTISPTETVGSPQGLPPQ